MSEPLATIKQYRISFNRNTMVLNDHFITEGHATFNCMKSYIQTQLNKNISYSSALQCLYKSFIGRKNYEKLKIFLSTLSGAHFSVKLILAINGNLGVFGVADHDSGIRIAKLKIADPRWRLCDSNVEFFEHFAQNTLCEGFWSRRLQI